ncbi:hypothetical protein NPIL_115991 [Nephila pilipes]|uniref:Uncharacterized protein n=1 Tax=Nephila pilipes TaxID=299642 RepID=A0A8X6QXC0_NEPPI|nr:hypothetical protein NPIL_115991 [Nephila pilipes]
MAEVIPTPDVTAKTTAIALMYGWIFVFGCPVTITVDQEFQFHPVLSRCNGGYLHLNQLTDLKRNQRNSPSSHVSQSPQDAIRDVLSVNRDQVRAEYGLRQEIILLC